MECVGKETWLQLKYEIQVIYLWNFQPAAETEAKPNISISKQSHF